MTVHIDYYELLGVQRGADGATIKSAYRRLAMECHPERHGGCTDKEARFKAISEAATMRRIGARLLAGRGSTRVYAAYNFSSSISSRSKTM